MTTNKAQRQRRILLELDQRPSLRVGELAKRLDVSAETIRRDLDQMTGRGLIERTYGGAVRRLGMEPSVSERHRLMVTEREGMARAAYPLLAGARHLMIGSGATTVHVARRVAMEMNGVTVLTHAFGVATVLSLNPTVTVILLPGVYHPSEGAVHGVAAINFLQRFRADWAILGASGLTEEGPSDALIEAAEVYSAMLARAERGMVVADHSKFEQRFPARYAAWREVDALITDRAPPGPLHRAIEEGSKITLAVRRQASP